jgi:type VI secretion system secreted protein VgrG
MSPSLQQKDRYAELNTPAGKDKFVLVSFECVEGLSELFEYRLDVLTKNSTYNFDDMIGCNCTVTYHTLSGDKRYFDGILTETQWLGKEIEENYACRFVLRPWLWLLSLRKNCLIYHEKTAPQIISEIFSAHGFAKFNNKLQKNYPTLEYCVQYRESDMAFVCRLMEEYGINYYFEHSEGEHNLVLSDETMCYKTIPGGSRRFDPEGPVHFSEKETLGGWWLDRQLTTGKVTLADYEFKTPQADMKAEQTGDAQYENGKLEAYDYPGRYTDRGKGMDLARVRLDRERAFDGHFEAEGNCVSCFPGGLFTLEDHPDRAQNEEYLILKCFHSYEDQHYRSRGAVTGGEQYKGRYELVRSNKPYVPPMVTQRPFIRGAQTAEVVGDGEIHVDKYGRIRVRFHWDAKKDQSMWSRVAQVWAGPQWGGVYIPRVGMEVIVHFLEGDPDRPFVVGALYNKDNMPPYKLPDEKNKAGLKSDSTLGGGGYNEFIFDDTAGSEFVRLHAQRDLKSVVEHEEEREVKLNRKSKVGNNDSLDVGSTLKIDAGTRIEMTVGASKITMTTAKITIESPTIEVKAQSYTTSAVTSEHSAAAVMDIKGAIVKIN